MVQHQLWLCYYACIVAVRRSRRARAAGGSTAPAQPPAPDGLFDGVFGARPPAVVVTGGAARQENPLVDLGEAWDPWDTAKEENRAAEDAAGGPPSRRRAFARAPRFRT